MKHLIAIILTTFVHTQPSWLTIHGSRQFSISGVASFENGFLVVHDNKKMKQPRLSYLDRSLKLRKLIWPETNLPYDLEALHLMPGFANKFVAMESTGKAYIFLVDPFDFRIEILSTITLPGISNKMNLEGFAVFQSAQGTVFIYGDRGSNKRKSTLITAFFDPQNNKIDTIEKFIIDLPIPKKSKRNIADIAIDKNGAVWTVATSDPGNNGPFKSAIYQIGHLNNVGTFNYNHPDLLKPLIVIDEQKIEAMMFKDNELVLMTDNENNGSSYFSIKEAF